MRKIFTYTVIVLLIASAVGYGLNRFTEAANEKKVQKIMDRYEGQIKELNTKVNILEYEALEARRQAEASKGRAVALKRQREALKAPQSAEETVERLHKLGFASERIVR